jgi:hypothetical protein
VKKIKTVEKRGNEIVEGTKLSRRRAHHFDPLPETSAYFGWWSLESGISTEWQPGYKRQELRSRLTSSLIPTAGSYAR